ncbi:MAG TPA: hypothetical protein VM511_02950 [Luteolibacter sp.]|nr:hypothetical protein [Luteolibacter sp.]
MNDNVQGQDSLVFYPVVIGTSAIMAFVLSPTPDLISLALLALLTISSSVVIGVLLRRLRYRPSFRGSCIVLPAVIGVLGSLLGLIGANVLFRVLA